MHPRNCPCEPGTRPMSVCPILCSSFCAHAPERQRELRRVELFRVNDLPCLFSCCRCRMKLSTIMSRGALIVIEGVDRCGKTSQTMKLIESLRKKNIQAERMAFPDRTTWTGQIISKYLSDKEYKLTDQAIHLLFTANRWENVDKMKEKLDEGITLVVDRYSYSGVAFSVAKGMDLHWCMQPEIGLPKPDLVLFLNIKPENQKARPGFGGERYETSALQKKVNKIYQQFVFSEDNWQVVDANDSFDTVHAELLHNIENKIQYIKQHNKPLQYLTDTSSKENLFANHIENNIC